MQLHAALTVPRWLCYQLTENHERWLGKHYIRFRATPREATATSAASNPGARQGRPRRSCYRLVAPPAAQNASLTTLRFTHIHTALTLLTRRQGLKGAGHAIDHATPAPSAATSGLTRDSQQSRVDERTHS